MKIEFFKYKKYVTLVLLMLFCVHFNVGAQVIFSESFDESDNVTNGTENSNAVNWSTDCPTCLDAGDFFKVQSGELVGQDSNGPATWETATIDISTCDFFDISFLLKEEGSMEACGTGCTSVDWVQLQYNIDNTGWQDPDNSLFCAGGCAGINVIQSDDISGGAINYSTGCIESGSTLQIRITIQAWAASERWILDDIEVSCSTGPEVNAGLDEQSCGADVLLTATNPDGALISWNNGITDGVAFTPTNGTTNYVAYAELAGCIATDTVEVSMTSAPVFNVLGTNPTTCGGNDGFITISGLNNSTDYNVTYDDGAIQGPSTLTSNTSGEIVIANMSAGTYTDFNLELNGCSTLDPQNIILTDPNAPSINAGTDLFVCTGDDVELNATNPDGAVLNWDNGITNATTFQAINGNTIYTITANLNGCISTDVVEITGTDSPTVDAGMDQTICENTSITLNATNPNTANITWDNGVTDGTTFIPVLGVNTYEVTAELNGCSITDNVTITVNELPSFVVSGTNPTSCGGSDGKIILSGLTANTTYDLSHNNGANIGPNTILTDNTGQYEITNLPAGNYTTFTINKMGCSTTVIDVISLNDPATPNVYAGDDVLVCLGEEISLTAVNNDNGTITWDNNIQDGVYFPALSDETYTVTVEKNNCFNTDVVNVVVLSAPTINAGLDLNICIGDSVQLSADNPNGGMIEWNNNISDGVSFVPQSTNSYIVTASIGSCVNSDTVEITVNQGPNADFTFNPNNPTIQNTEVQFTSLYSNPETETYAWSFGDNQYSTVNSPVHFYPEVGNATYQVDFLVIDNFGCKDSSTTFITVDDILLYYVPNAFTPDGDQINNTFMPVFTSGFDLDDYHLTIFNRWGEILFESNNNQIGWNGTYGNGGIVEQGVYVYTILFGDLKTDERQIVTGTVTLLK